MNNKAGFTTDALEILHNLYFKDDPEALARIAREEEKCAIAARIYEWRTQAGMSQRSLADKIGTTPSVISRFEKTLEDNYTVTTLKKIASVFGRNLQEFFEDKTSADGSWSLSVKNVEDGFKSITQSASESTSPNLRGELLEETA